MDGVSLMFLYVSHHLVREILLRKAYASHDAETTLKLHMRAMRFSPCGQAASPVFFAAPGTPSSDLVPSKKSRGWSTERRIHSLCAHTVASVRRLSALHRGFSVPGTVLPCAQRRALHSPDPAAFAAFAATRAAIQGSSP